MLYVEKHGQIIDILKQRTSATVHYLAKELHVSEPTIRRDFLENSVAYVGTSAQDFTKNFNADLFLFSCRGISNDGILSDSSIEETDIRKVMMKHSKKNIFLCSSDKIGKQYMYTLCSHKDIDDIICDEAVNLYN